MSVHAGGRLDPETGAVTTPIHQTSTFAYPERPRGGGWVASDWAYSRYSNPTVAAVEAKMAALEGAERSLMFASGMAAAAASILPFVGPGERVAAMSGIYGGTQLLLRRQVARLGIAVDATARVDAQAIADLATESTRVVLTEIPTNPLSRVVDLPLLAKLLSRRFGRQGPVLVTDATFATPVNLRPLERGAHVAFHSATKYLNGHADLIGGLLSGSARRLDAAESWRRDVGAVPDPHQAFLLERGLKTLVVRLRRAEANARRVAEALEADRRVAEVWFLGLPSHPDHRLGRRLLNGPGAVVTFRLRRGTVASARRVRRNLELFAPAPSLGGVESLVSLPIETSHVSASASERREQGITPGMVRLAVGVEDADDLVADLKRALRA